MVTSDLAESKNAKVDYQEYCNNPLGQIVDEQIR